MFIKLSTVISLLTWALSFHLMWKAAGKFACAISETIEAARSY